MGLQAYRHKLLDILGKRSDIQTAPMSRAECTCVCMRACVCMRVRVDIKNANLQARAKLDTPGFAEMSTPSKVSLCIKNELELASLREARRHRSPILRETSIEVEAKMGRQRWCPAAIESRH